jgi:diguanylate cyclase (GGDEF)-like protein
MLGSAAAAVAIALAWILGRQSTAPLRQLTSAARQIGRDPSITKLPRLEGSREIAELSTALRSLLRRVGAAEQSQHDVQEQSALKTLMLEEEITTLHRAASTDPLTGLLNRRAFRTLAEDAMTYHRRYRRPIAILMADIDHFKRVNDTFGHAAGDAVIKTIGGVIVSAVRTTDKVARFGGEEFVVLLREIEPDAALLLAERMRQQVEAMVVRHGEEDVRVTLSLGVALVDDCDRDVEALIERADAALYEAKRRGRNRARIASSIELDRAA